jgi:hypothetical protein
MSKKIFFALVVIGISQLARSQDSSRVFFTTGAGIIKSPGSLSKVLQPSVAFNSGIEFVIKKNWFVQGTLILIH